jgi:hypothetical protein
MTPTARVAQRNTDISALVYVNGSVRRENHRRRRAGDPLSRHTPDTRLVGLGEHNRMDSAGQPRKEKS